MASSTMTNMPGRHLLVPDTLNVKGHGLSPRPSPPTTPETAVLSTKAATASQSSMSDEDASERSEEYTVLDGVREMNQILVRQIETLRLKIKIDERNNDEEKKQLLATKDTEIRSKETEIEDLRESLTSRDEKIHQLMKSSQEKDRTLQSKCDEIDELKNMVKQTKEYAIKIQKQFGRLRQQKDKLDADPLYHQQNEEIRRLNEELELLRSRLTTMEQELARALKIIEQQNESLKKMDAEREALQAKFREDLEKTSRAMRQEVERMREVMRQNYEEMRLLREQNKEMHNDVRAIKEMLRNSRSGRENSHHQHESVTDLHHPSHHSPAYTRQLHGHTTALAPKGPGKMVGTKMSKSTLSRPQTGVNGTLAHNSPLVRESSQFASKNRQSNLRTGTTRVAGHSQLPNSNSSNNTSRLSPDTSARPIATPHSAKTDNKGIPFQNLNVPQSSPPSRQSFLPVCSFQEGTPSLLRQPSGRGAKGGIRRGSALRRQ